MGSESTKTAYVPPHKREGFVERVEQESPHLYSGEVIKVFETMGWVHGSGGELYFNGRGTTAHPHLHLRIGDVSSDYYRVMREKKDVRRAIAMVAWSDGGQGRGGGGVTFIRDGKLLEGVNGKLGRCNLSNAMYREILWILDFFE
jgi:hypothetical protein